MKKEKKKKKKDGVDLPRSSLGEDTPPVVVEQPKPEVVEPSTEKSEPKEEEVTPKKKSKKSDIPTEEGASLSRKGSKKKMKEPKEHSAPPIIVEEQVEVVVEELVLPSTPKSRKKKPKASTPDTGSEDEPKAEKKKKKEKKNKKYEFVASDSDDSRTDSIEAPEPEVITTPKKERKHKDRTDSEPKAVDEPKSEAETKSTPKEPVVEAIPPASSEPDAVVAPRKTSGSAEEPAADEDFMASEASIININVANLLEKWKEIERSAEKEEEAKPVSESPKRANGNVFQFLQQKQRELREEEEKDSVATKLDGPLPAPPAVPASAGSEAKPSSTVPKSIRNKRLNPTIALNTASIGPTVLYDYTPTDTRMVTLKKGKAIRVIRKDFHPDWCEVIFDGKRGFAPINFIQFPAEPKKEEPKKFETGTKHVAASHSLDNMKVPKVEVEPEKPRSNTVVDAPGAKGLFDILDEEEPPKPVDVHALASASWASLQEGIMPQRKASRDKDDDQEIEISDPRRWKFSEPDSEANILFKESKDDQQPIIRGATIEKLIQRLTHEKFPDPDRLLNFLLTYRQITTPEELFELLHLRFHPPRPKDVDHDTFKKETLLPIRLRVVNVVKTWLRRALSDLREGNTLQLLKDFVKNTIEKPMPQAAKELNALIVKEEAQLSKPPVLQFSQKPPKPHIPKNLKAALTLTDLHPEELARQITLYEHEIYRAIQSTELIKQRWTSKHKNELASHISKLISWFNQISGWVAIEILEIEDLKQRALTLNRFIFIAQKCRELNNYNATMEILSALQNSAIHRLQKTWELLPPKTVQMYEELLKLMDGEGNFANYREQLQVSTPPMLPYLGLFLTDMVFIYDGNPDYIPGTKLINVAKLDLLAGTMKVLQRYQDTPYCLDKLDFMQDFIKQKSTIAAFCDDDLLYKMSTKLEEKASKKRA